MITLSSRFSPKNARTASFTVLFGILVIAGAPLLLSACNTAAGAKEDVSAATHAITGDTNKNKPEVAQAQQSQPPAAPMTAAAIKDPRVEARIKSLHDRLKITSAEEPQWSGVAQAMRDNAQQMQAAVEQRRQARSMTAVDDLKAHQTITNAHAQGLAKLIPAFQTLYDSLSDDQKKLADAIFAESGHHKKTTHKKADAGTQPSGSTH
jgi:periplasmic protein CpxP/Spy